MAFKLTPDEKTRRDDVRDKLTAARTALWDFVEKLNSDQLTPAREAMDALVATYNEALDEARDLAEGIASDARTEYDDKSEKWQESDKGQAADSWIVEWEGIDLSDIDLEGPADIDFSGVDDHAETLNNLPDEPQE